MKRTVVTVLLSWFVMGLMAFGLASYLDAQAAPAAPDVECVEWAKAGPWTITRCEDWSAGEVCLIANSGMIVCRFD